MPCTPFSVDSGFFIAEVWSTAANTSAGGRTITRTDDGITVEDSDGDSVFHATLGTSKYMMFGSGNYVLILESEEGVGPIQHWVSLIDLTGAVPVEVPIMSVLTPGAATPPPHIERSQGSGSAFLVYASDGDDTVGVAIYRSDNGEILCPGPPPFHAEGETQGSATATHLVIHYTDAGGSHDIECPIPKGELDVLGGTKDFGQVKVGGCPTAPPTETFTLRNDGDDCLEVNAIANSPPFTVASTSIPLPATLDPGEQMTVDVAFTPVAITSYGPTNLIITRTPPNGDDRLTCEGEGRAPETEIGFSAMSLNFGMVPVGTTSAAKTLTISNVGETPLDNVSLAGSPGGSPFDWPSFAGDIPCGGSHAVPITFTPPAEGPFDATLTVLSPDPDSPDTINVHGEGCIANAGLDVPPAPFPAFGDVQRGFRTVRFITIRNTGDGQLTFTARIHGPDAALFGLQLDSGSITEVQAIRDYVVDPITPCGPGPSGSGEAYVAVVFWANAAPPYTATATLTIDNHNDAEAPASFTFPLSANVIAPINVDAAVVLDRSKSMEDLVGERRKFEAAVSAGQLFAELMRPDVGDRIAVVKFNQEPELIQGLEELTDLNQTPIRNSISNAELAPDGWTSIAGGTIMALDELDVAAPNPTRAVVVLSDGMDNRAYQRPGEDVWYSVLGGESKTPDGDPVDTTALTVPAGIKVYGVALGKEEDIDRLALDWLSGTTGGYYGNVGNDLAGPTYFNLEKYFTQIFMDMVEMPVVEDPVFTIQPGEEQKFEFDVLRGDVNALVVVYDRQGWRLPFHLASPTGELIDPSHVPVGYQLRSGFTSTARFVEFIAPAGQPDRYAGRWAVVVKHPGEFCVGPPVKGKRAKWGFLPQRCKKWPQPIDYGIAIGVGSNFRMQPYVTPGPVMVGESITLTAVLTEAGLPVTGCTVTVKAVSPSGSTWDFSLLDDGMHADADPNDAEYARIFKHTAEGGSYDFFFRAVGTSHDGEPVVREAMRSKYVEGRVTVGQNPTRPGGGFGRNCCKELIRLLKRQNELLGELVKKQGSKGD